MYITIYHIYCEFGGKNWHPAHENFCFKTRWVGSWRK